MTHYEKMHCVQSIGNVMEWKHNIPVFKHDDYLLIAHILHKWLRRRVRMWWLQRINQKLMGDLHLQIAIRQTAMTTLFILTFQFIFGDSCKRTRIKNAFNAMLDALIHTTQDQKTWLDCCPWKCSVWSNSNMTAIWWKSQEMHHDNNQASSL